MRISDWSSDVCSSDLEADGVAGGAEIAPYEGDVAGFDGDVGAGAHGEAEVGLGEGGGVVDAVTDHGHRAALSLEALDDVDLVLRQHLGDDFVDADLGGDGAGSPLVVAGQQHRQQTDPTELPDALRRGCLAGAGDDEDRT